jgi:methyltransferase
MIAEAIGWPQIAALLVLLQRGAEELYSARNTRRLITAGGQEAGRSYYPVVATTHLAWIASLFFLIPANAPISTLLATCFVLLTAARYWVIATLGRFWTHRIITLKEAPIVRSGPYALVRHPNYVVTVAETFLLPAIFGAWAVAFIMTAVWAAVLSYKIKLEDAALAARRQDLVEQMT